MEYVLEWLTVTHVIVIDESLSIGDQDKVKTTPGARISSRPSSKHSSRPTTPIDLIKQNNLLELVQGQQLTHMVDPTFPEMIEGQAGMQTMSAADLRLPPVHNIKYQTPVITLASLATVVKASSLTPAIATLSQNRSHPSTITIEVLGMPSQEI